MLLPYMLLLLWFVTAAAVVAANGVVHGEDVVAARWSVVVHGEGQPHQQLPAPIGRRGSSNMMVEGRLPVPNFSSMRRLSEDEMNGRGGSKLIRGVLSASKRVGGWG